MKRDLTGQERDEAGRFRLSNIMEEAWGVTLECAGALWAKTILFQRPAGLRPTKENVRNLRRYFRGRRRYGFAGEAVYRATQFAQVGFAQALDQELRAQGIKVGVIRPGGVKTEFAIGQGLTGECVARSSMLDPRGVAGVVLLSRTQSPGSRIIEIRMRPMSEPLA